MINFRKIVSLFSATTIALMLATGMAMSATAASTDLSAKTLINASEKVPMTENTDSKTNNSTDETPSENVYYKTTKKRVVIKKKVVKRRSSSLPVGCKKVVQKGKNGVMVKTITKTYSTETNELLSTTQREKVVRKAKNKVVVTGTRRVVSKINRGASRLGNVKKKIVMSATAYTHTGNRTASGRVAKVGHVAVDPRVIPLGSLLYIKSNDGGKDYGFCIAADTGGAIKGKRVDLFFNTRRECINFGRRKVTVLVLGK